MFLRIFLGIIIVIGGLLIIRKFTWLPNPYHTVSIPRNELPKFEEISVDFIHHFDKSKSLPFMGAAVFDLKGDGKQHLFVGGGYNQADKLFVFQGEKFVDITEQVGLTKEPEDTTYGVAAIDVNQDGIIDLFVARESGVYLYIFENGRYKGKKLDIPLDPKHAPLSIAVADLKKRGLVDLFICAYIKTPFVEGETIFNKEGYGGRSLLLLNNGDNTFKDITKEAGLDYVHNTFQAVFVDLDDDGNLDLVVAHDTGKVRTYKNMGNLTFKNMPNPTSDVFSYPMGIAVGDYFGEGRPDLFFSNIGPFYWWNLGATPPNLIVRGDLRKDQFLLRTQIFFKNEGNFKFSDVSHEVKVADYEFGWGVLFQDFTNRGLLDLVIAENYIGFPPHKILRLPGRFLMQAHDKTLVPVEKAIGVENPYYAISPLTADFNGNGHADLVFTNLDGPLRVFLNQGSSNHFLKVEMKNEPQALGAKVVVEMLSGEKLTSFFVPTQGLCTYQTNTLFFGLGKETDVKNVLVYFTNGETRRIETPKVDSTLKVE